LLKADIRNEANPEMTASTIEVVAKNFAKDHWNMLGWSQPQASNAPTAGDIDRNVLKFANLSRPWGARIGNSIIDKTSKLDT